MQKLRLTSRMVIYGAYSPSLTNVMDFVTIASTGDTQDFGDVGGGLKMVEQVLVIHQQEGVFMEGGVHHPPESNI